ncbi:hypothetical protein BD769DRAFT_1500456 [Suillus cothurnatus]|nr:hypothetical protein BD769DRAFT_1500456 [Suillus cothurnatus]
MRSGKVDSEKLLAMAKALNAYAKSQPDVQARINDGTELVLELSIDKGNTNIIKSCGEILFNVKAAKKFSHIKYSLESQYWLVLSKGSLYPHNRYLPRQIFDELREIIIHANAETITSDTSLAPFDGNELARMLDLMDRIEGNIDKMHAHSVCVVARFMRLFSTDFILQFAKNTDNAQPRSNTQTFVDNLEHALMPDRSIYYKEGHERETLVFRLSNLILWYGPRKHHKRIQRVWVDEIINAPRWKDFITQLDTEWTWYTLYVTLLSPTVLLAVDVSFLAVPGITTDSSSQTSSNIAVYMSALCSVGSLVVSVLLVDQSYDFQTAEGGALYMSLMTSAIPGIENLALMHSLPFALLVWAMVFFGLALSMLIFHTGDVVTLATMVPGWTIVIIFTLWPTMTTHVEWLLNFAKSLPHQPKRVIRSLRDSRLSIGPGVISDRVA